MRKIKVSSLPLKDVIADISKALQIDFVENCSLYELELPSYIGKGKIVGIDFESGLGIIEYDCTFFEDISFEFSKNEVHPLKFLFCLEGSFDHNFMDETIWHNIPQYKNAIVASNKSNGHVLRFKKNERILLHSLELSRREFRSKMSCELKSLSTPIKALLEDIKAQNTFYYDGYYSLQLADLFREFHKFEDRDYIKKLYMEGLAYKILTLQIIQYQDDLKREGLKTILRQAEVKKIEKAISLIESEIGNLPTIEVIAAEVGLNPKKLQKGFRDIIGSSVNSYIQKRRLEMAKTLMLNTELSLSEISATIGYRNKSYLSKVFKIEYGMSPSEFRSKNV